MAKISVNGNVLRWVSDRSGLTFNVLEKNFPHFRQWVKETLQPNLKQLERLAKKTNTPLGYFFLPEPPKEQLPIPYFRTVGDDGLKSPSPDLLETVYTMQQRQEWMREFLIEEGQMALPFVGSAKITDNLKSIANDIRNVLGLANQWAVRHRTWTAALSDLFHRIEEINILVVANGVVGNNNYRSLDTEEFRGFVLHDRIAPLIFVNSTDSKGAQMFTLAHEIAHVWFGSSAAFDLRELQPANDATEKACNRVAAEVLVPENELREIWPTVARAREPFQLVARQFKVSSLIAARRALDMELIDTGAFLSFYNAYQKDDRRKRDKRDGGNFWNTQNVRIGRRFGSAVVSAAKEGRLLYKDAYRLTGLSGKTFDKYTEKIFSAL